MPIKCYRTNTDFDLKHFVASEAHTPDGKHVLWAAQLNLLKEQYAGFKAMVLRKEAREEELMEILDATTDSASLTRSRIKMIQAELIEIRAGKENDRLNEAGGLREIQTLTRLIEQIRPLCKYLDFDLLDQQEAIQEEEWLCELQSRARKHIACTGSIPVDQLTAMMAHPKFDTHVKPLITNALKISAKTDTNADSYGFAFTSILRLS